VLVWNWESIHDYDARCDFKDGDADIFSATIQQDGVSGDWEFKVQKLKYSKWQN
jgi:hypothetical protein